MNEVKSRVIYQDDPKDFITFRPIYEYFLGTFDQNAQHGKVAPGVYLHFTNPSIHLNVPIWVPKVHSPKKFNLVFKKT